VGDVDAVFAGLRRLQRTAARAGCEALSILRLSTFGADRSVAVGESVCSTAPLDYDFHGRLGDRVYDQ